MICPWSASQYAAYTPKPIARAAGPFARPLPAWLHALRWHFIFRFKIFRAITKRVEAFDLFFTLFFFLGCGLLAMLITGMVITFGLRTQNPLQAAGQMFQGTLMLTLLGTPAWSYPLWSRLPARKSWPEIIDQAWRHQVVEHPELVTAKLFDRYVRYFIELYPDSALYFLSHPHPPNSTLTPKDLAPLFLSPEKDYRLLALEYATRLQAKPETKSRLGWLPNLKLSERPKAST